MGGAVIAPLIYYSEKLLFYSPIACLYAKSLLW